MTENSQVGIPYAFAEVVDGQLYRICPICNKRIAETHDNEGEQTSNGYGEHYAAKHETRLLPDGRHLGQADDGSPVIVMPICACTNEDLERNQRCVCGANAWGASG